MTMDFMTGRCRGEARILVPRTTRGNAGMPVGLVAARLSRNPCERVRLDGATLDFRSVGSPNVRPTGGREARQTVFSLCAKEFIMAYQPGKFVWYEHVSNDIPQARGFYEKLFGWNTEMMAMGGGDPYPVIHNGEDGIAGYATAPSGAPTQWLSYLSVGDVDSSYKAALAAGARSVMAPTDYGSAGRAATLADPTGGVFALWKGAQGDPDEKPQAPVGHFFWNELATSDDQKALAFYEKVFDFRHDTMPMPEGTYYVLKRGEHGIAGLYQPKTVGQPTMWTPYVKVADADAISARATELGAKVVVPPSDIPNVGRFSFFTDPLGATLAIMKPDPAMG
jgi:predicted enzyme related to lactoylglutathione lyase